MLNWLVFSLFTAILSFEYLIRERGLLHPYFLLLPELLSAIAAIIVMARIVGGARINLDARYVAVLTLLGATMLAGFIMQDVPSGTIVAGVRQYLMFLPFFLLPTVTTFTSKQIKTQFVVLIVFFLAQAPLAIYQRFFEYADLMQTGDPVRGTATTSSALSMLMLCAIAATVSLYLRKKLSLIPAILIIGVLFLPTTLNETKATFLLLPVAMILPMLFMPSGTKQLRRILPIAAVGIVSLGVFITVYNYFIQFDSFGQPIGQFFSEAGYVHYLYSGAAEQGANYIGRADSLEFAIKYITRDPLTTAFGYGAGNVSLSFLPQFEGTYAAYYERFGVGMTQMTTFLWEIGVVGAATYLMLYYFVARDAQLLARRDDVIGILGQVWVTVMAIMTFALVYKAVFSMTEIGYLFWFYSGVVASAAIEQRRRRRAKLMPWQTGVIGSAPPDHALGGTMASNARG